MQLVEDAINEITEEKINTHVNLTIIDMGNYVSQVNLIVSSGEKLDLMVNLPSEAPSFASMLSQNQLLDITELLNEHAKELLSIFPESWLGATTVDGKIYGVPSMGDKANTLYFICRTDVLEKTGVDPETIETADDLTNLFSIVAEVAPEIIPLTSSNKTVIPAPFYIDQDQRFKAYDSLGDSLNVVSILDSNPGTVQLFYETDEWKNTYTILQNWYRLGYIDKDASNRNDTAESQVKAGTSFGYIKSVQNKAAADAANNYDMTLIPLGEFPVDTGAVRKFVWSVPTTATEPEAAVKLMNLLYTDKELYELFLHGIKDLHYKINEDGTIGFPEGIDSANSGYYIGNMNNILGNGFLSYPWEGNPSDYYEQRLEVNLTTPVSEYMGFGASTVGFENEVTAISNVMSELWPALKCGLGEEDDNAVFVTRLKAVGCELYIDGVTEQLKEWLKTK